MLIFMTGNIFLLNVKIGLGVFDSNLVYQLKLNWRYSRLIEWCDSVLLTLGYFYFIYVSVKTEHRLRGATHAMLYHLLKKKGPYK